MIFYDIDGIGLSTIIILQNHSECIFFGNVRENESGCWTLSYFYILWFIIARRLVIPNISCDDSIRITRAISSHIHDNFLATLLVLVNICRNRSKFWYNIFYLDISFARITCPICRTFYSECYRETSEFCELLRKSWSRLDTVEIFPCIRKSCIVSVDINRI